MFKWLLELNLFNARAFIIIVNTIITLININILSIRVITTITNTTTTTSIMGGSPQRKLCFATYRLLLFPV